MAKPKRHNQLTPERLRETLHYDKDTGLFHWVAPQCHRIKPGDPAGSHDGSRYFRIMVDCVRYKAHRLAWLYVYGKWPDGVIDHINGNPGDNRIANLRDVSEKANAQNVWRARINNKTSGLLGVYGRGVGPNPWSSSIGYNQQRYHLGRFATPEEAHEAYLKAKRAVHEGCTI